MKFTKAKIGALAGAAVLAVSLAAACSSGGGGSSAHSSGYAFSQAAISGNTSEGADLTQAQTADDKPQQRRADRLRGSGHRLRRLTLGPAWPSAGPG